MAALVQFGSFIFGPDSTLTSFLSVLGRRVIFLLQVFLIRDHRAYSSITG